MINPMNRRTRSYLIFVCSLLLSGGVLHAGLVELVSRANPHSDTATGPPDVFDPENVSVSADGRYIAFASTATNLVPNQIDRNGGRDVFLHDRVAKTTVLVSHTLGVNHAIAGDYGPSYHPSISADGRWVAFVSTSYDLANGNDTFDSEDVFLYDRTTQTNIKVSVSGDGQLVRGSYNPVVSADGSWVAFLSLAPDLVAGQTDSNSTLDVFLYDVASATRTLVSRAAGSTTTAADYSSYRPSISADGRYVAFGSDATNLVAGQSDANGPDVFLFDRVTGTMTLLSRSAASALTTVGGSSPAVSADGAYVAFTSASANVVAGQTDANNSSDVFLWERAAGTTTLVSRSVSSPTTAGNQYVDITTAPRISADGRYVAFLGVATDYVTGQVDTNGNSDAFLFDRTTGTTVLVSHASGSATTAANALSIDLSLSADGRYLVFSSSATDLVAGQSDSNGQKDVFLFDRTTGTNRLLSGAGGSATTAGNKTSILGVISADGSRAAFWTGADDLVAGVDDLNQMIDLVLHDVAAGTNTLLTLHDAGLISFTPAGMSVWPSVSADDRYVAFTSSAGNLVPGLAHDNFFSTNVFLTDRHAMVPTTVLVGQLADSAVISADGNYVAFLSRATDVVSGQVDGNAGPDVFLYDRAAGTTTLVSHAAGSATTTGDRNCAGWPEVSADGRWVAYVCLARDLTSPAVDSNDHYDVFLFDRTTGENVLVSHAAGAATTAGNALSFDPVISADGSRIAFASQATDLVSGSDTNGGLDVFLYDRASGTITLVSRSAGLATTTGNDESSSPDLSADGRVVAFSSEATNLLPGQSDAANTDDLFVFDATAGSMALATHHSSSVSLSPGGQLGSIFDLSADGRYVAFASRGLGFVGGLIDDRPAVPGGTLDVFVYDRLTQATDIVSASAFRLNETAFEDSWGPRISDGGRFVAFVSNAPDVATPNLFINNPPHVYLHDRGRKKTELVSRSFNLPDYPGDEPTWPQIPIALSSDGTLVAFDSPASNLTPADYNGSSDVFVYQWSAPLGTALYTVAPCRVLDTRTAGPLASNVTYNLTIAGHCGIPPSARAIVANVTVVQPTGPGHMTFFPEGLPPFSTTINFSAGQIRGNNAVLQLSADGHLRVQPVVLGPGLVHLILDVSGYFQ